jgi:hypothetical protein
VLLRDSSQPMTCNMMSHKSDVDAEAVISMKTEEVEEKQFDHEATVKLITTTGIAMNQMRKVMALLQTSRMMLISTKKTTL